VVSFVFFGCGSATLWLIRFLFFFCCSGALVLWCTGVLALWCTFLKEGFMDIKKVLRSIAVLLFPLAIAFAVSYVQVAVAAWSNASAANNAISTAANEQSLPTIISDLSGGAIITWHDYRNTGDCNKGSPRF
jgi:hypothetical protein